MTKEEFFQTYLEVLAEKAHNAWWEEKKSNGFHHPNQCKDKIHPPNIHEQTCHLCHSDMADYNILSEQTKDYDRKMVIQVLNGLFELDIKVYIKKENIQ